MRPPDIVVRVGDYTLESVQQFSVRLSMREPADSFALTINDRVDFPAGSPVGIAINGRVVLIGEVMTARLSKSAGRRDYTVEGFSSAQRLVKSSAAAALPTRLFKTRSLRQICEQVCEPFGIAVDVATSAIPIADEEVEAVRVNNGEKA